MEIRGATEEEIKEAIRIINSEEYGGNVKVYVSPKNSKTLKVNLSVNDSHGKGARLGFTGRHMINACWHVHGNFFDTLLNINPKVVIKAMNRKIYKDEDGRTIGNWEDWNIGSLMSPLYCSEACECDDSDRAKEIKRDFENQFPK